MTFVEWEGEMKELEVVKLGWSGGKDSTCAAMLHIERGDKVKAINYIPMFTEGIPLITKRHYEFIIKTAEYLKSRGAEVYEAKGMTYWDYVTYIKRRGKNKGTIMGFPAPITGKCGFKTYSKISACKEADKRIGYYDYESIGIAYDEYKRHSQISEKKRSILIDQRYTERDCFKYCYEKGLLSPHYEYEMRDGCSLCPNGNKIRRDIWLSDYPKAEELLIELQEIVKISKLEKYPLRDGQWFIETRYKQMTIWDELYGKADNII